MRPLGDRVGNRDALDVRLPDEIVDGAITHAAGAKHQNLHEGFLGGASFFVEGKNAGSNSTFALFRSISTRSRSFS